MSLDLYQNEVEEDFSQRGVTKEVPAGVMDNFAYGAGMGIARAGAETGRAASMAVGAFPVMYDKMFGTDYADAYFKNHDEVFQNAVEYWTPQANEVGVAGEVVGQLVGTLGLVGIAPSLAVAKTQMSVAEDLARKGVETSKAIGVGAVQGLGLGAGIWMPVLGKTLAQRVLVGGVAANVAQGAATRGLSAATLKDTVAEGDFEAFNATDLTLDVLLGAAFGGIAHLSRSQRAQGEKAWSRIESMAERFNPSDIDAIQTLRQAQHLNVDSMGGMPDGPLDTDSHVQRVKKAIDQLSQDQRVDVSDLPEAKINADGRFDEANTRVQELVKDAERIRGEDGIPEERLIPKQKSVDIEPARKPVISEKSGDPNVDPVVSEARRIADSSESKFIVGRDVNDEPVRSTAKELLDNADADVKRANEDVSLFKAAAACLMGAA